MSVFFFTFVCPNVGLLFSLFEYLYLIPLVEPGGGRGPGGEVRPVWLGLLSGEGEVQSRQVAFPACRS